MASLIGAHNYAPASNSLPLSLGQGSRENTLRVEPPNERGQALCKWSRTGDAAPEARDDSDVGFSKPLRRNEHRPLTCAFDALDC